MKKASAGGLFANERKANMPAATATNTPANAAAGKKGPHPTPTGKRKYVRKKPLPNRKGGAGAAGQPLQGAGVGGAAGGVGVGPGGMAMASTGMGGAMDPNAPGAAGGIAGGVGGGINGVGAQGAGGAAGGAAGPKAKRAPVIKVNPYYQPKISLFMDGKVGGGAQDGHGVAGHAGVGGGLSKHVVRYDPIPPQYMHQPKSSTVSNYCQALLRISCMHVLQSSGYDGVQANPLKVMTDCLDRYLRLLADSVKQYAEHAGRAQVSALDVVDGLADLGIDLADLKEWTAENGGPVTPNATIPVGSSNVKTQEGTSSNAATTKEGETNTNAGTTTIADTTSAPQGPVLPTWKGPDPSLVLKEEEQDEYAYPDNDSDEEDTSTSVQQQQRSSSTKTVEASKPTRRKGPQWDPQLRPDYIPDHMPPFPGAVLPGSEKPSVDTEGSEDEEEKAVAVQAKASAGMGTANEQAETTHGQDSTNKDSEAASSSETKQHITNPYTHVVPFFESTLPFSPLYASIPTTAITTTKQSSSSSAAATSTGSGSVTHPGSALSDRSRQLFQETLYSLSDPALSATNTAAQTQRKNSRLANSVVRSLNQPTDTLFSSFSHHAGIIDSLLKNSAPLTVMNKFANLGISVQDVLSSSPLTSGMEFPVGPLDPSLSSTGATAVGAGGGGSASAVGGRGNIPPLSNLRKNSASMTSSPLSIVTNAPSREETSLHTPQRRKSSLASVSASDQTIAGLSSLDSFGGSQETVVAAAPSSRRSSHSKASLDKSGANQNMLSPLSPTGIVKVEKEEPSFSSALSLSATSAPSQPVSLGSTQSISEARTTLASTATPISTAPPSSLAAAAPASTGPIMSLSSLPTPYGLPEQTTPAAVSTSKATSSYMSNDFNKQQQQQQQQQQQKQQQQQPQPAQPPAAPPLQSPTSTGAPKIRFKFSALESLPSDHDDGASHGSSSSTSVHKKEKKHHKHSKHHREHSHHHHYREGSVDSSSSHKKKRKSDYDDYGSDIGGDGGDDVVMRDKKKKKKKHKSKDRDYDRDDKYYRDVDRDRERDRDRDRERDHHRHHQESSSKSNGYDHDYDYGYGSSSSYGHRKTSSMSSVHGGSSTPMIGGGGVAAGTSTASPIGSSAGAQVSTAPLLPQYLPGQQAALKQQYMQMVLKGPRDDSINCICKNPQLDDGLFMVACDKCDDWFHGHCVDVRDGDVQGTWYCPRCQKKGYRA
ncbi:hypothetical protein BGW41_000118 [Actinomortierella wolfii]|nr:hypothetical protein BGW41_000118 [Actinomortierella wolfii]